MSVPRKALPDGVVVLPLDMIEPCPIQPRVNVAVELVERLTASMQAGRHQPMLEVEPKPGKRGRYQIVSGEQRWRAARAAGMTRLLARLHPTLGYLERLEKQYEENRLRADLDPIEEAHCILLDKTLRDIAVAEASLRQADIPFRSLADKRITDREDFGRHLDGLKPLLVTRKLHVLKVEGRLVVGALAPWRDTEQALGISESARKTKVAILRLPPRFQEALRTLPAEHAIQIARLDDPARQAELVWRAPNLTHRQIQAAVDRLRKDPHLAVEAALHRNVDATDPAPEGPLTFEVQLGNLTDLCRQLARTLTNLRPRLSSVERLHVVAVLTGLRQALASFEEVL